MDGTIEELLSDLKARLEALYGERLAGIYLYGSHAQGTATEASDVDILVVLEGSVEPGREITRMNPEISEVCLRHDELVSAIPVARSWFERRQSPFYRNVREEAVAV